MEEAARKRLWVDYARTKDPGIREKIILEYAPLVKVVAGRLHMYLGSNVEYEELVSYGIFGLIDAIDKFDSLKDVKFETYASLRIQTIMHPKHDNSCHQSCCQHNKCRYISGIHIVYVSFPTALI